MKPGCGGGAISFWVNAAALAGWAAPRRTTPGGQPIYSDLAIEPVLTLRLVFHLGPLGSTRPHEAHDCSATIRMRSALPRLGCALVLTCCLTWFVPRWCAAAGAATRRISTAARDELLAARYARGSRAERGRIPDEFAAVTGYRRKHAMRVLRAGQDRRSSSGPRPARRVYDGAVRAALVVLWEASDRICGKRLRPMLPVDR